MPHDGLELRSLRCRRGHRVLFDGLSTSVPRGRMLRVRGANGSGKTSLLRMVCGLTAAERGEIRWDGRDITRHRDDFHRQLVYLGHSPALKDELSAVENLQAHCGLAGIVCTAGQAAEALAKAGLGRREHLPARALSQGQRRRVGLARLALSAAASLWVLDEPFNALDDAACARLESLLSGHLAAGGVIVLTSHQLRDWEAGQPQIVVSLDAAGE